jgi:hypothetical protein
MAVDTLVIRGLGDRTRAVAARGNSAPLVQLRIDAELPSPEGCHLRQAACDHQILQKVNHLGSSLRIEKGRD